MKKIIALLIIVLSFNACDNKKNDKEEFEQAVQKLKEKNRQVKERKNEAENLTQNRNRKCKVLMLVFEGLWVKLSQNMQ